MKKRSAATELEEQGKAVSVENTSSVFKPARVKHKFADRGSSSTMTLQPTSRFSYLEEQGTRSPPLPAGMTLRTGMGPRTVDELFGKTPLGGEGTAAAGGGDDGSDSSSSSSTSSMFGRI